MPVTPFHFGPGLLGKALVSKYFSFSAFAITQVVIDVETGYRLLRDEWPLHRALHTVMVGTAVGVVVGALVHVAGRIVGRRFRQFRGGLLTRWHEGELGAALIGGAFGGGSHSFLDSIMHSDVQPYWPFAAGNPLLGVMGAGALHWSCVAAGLVAVGLLIANTAHERGTV